MSTPAAELHPCECGCGTMVARRYARGHWARTQRRLAPLPGPNVPDDELDMGLIEPDFPTTPPGGPGSGISDSTDDDEIEPDPPAGFLSAPPAGRERGSQRRAGPRLNATIKKDITAKVGLMLQIPGRIWQARDPWCGGAFIQQEPEIRDALAEIIFDSADLVAFFTGPAGGFMKYFNLLMACQPVGWAVWAHHISHSVGEDATITPGPDMAAYAA